MNSTVKFITAMGDCFRGIFFKMADPTGLEPVTLRSVVSRSNPTELRVRILNQPPWIHDKTTLSPASFK